MTLRRLALAALLASASPAAVQGEPCGPDGACAVPLGTYRVALPEGPTPEGERPALLFFHGAGRSGEIALDRTAMVEAFLEAGFVFIAPDGMERPDRGGSRGWFFLPPSQRVQLRDELDFARQVLNDAAARHGVDRARVAMSGYSIGGSLAWYLACRDAELAEVLMPVAGAFWRPHPAPEDCDGPVSILHTHGWRDTTVPLEGRLLDDAIVQGDVFHGMGVLREVNRCDSPRPDAFDATGPFLRRTWMRCAGGSTLTLALHPDGHVVPEAWADMAIEWHREVASGP